MSVLDMCRKVWGDNPRWRGLRVMTVSFLTALAGAVLALAAGGMRDLTAESLFRWPFEIALIVAWAIMICSFAAMLVGILLNLAAVLGRMR